MRKMIFFVCLAVMSGLSVLHAGAFSGADGTKPAKEAKKVEVAKDSTTTELSDYQKLFDKKKCETVKGLITIHKVDGKQILFEFPVEVLGKDMLFGSTLVKTSNIEHGVLGYKSKQPMHIRFEKEYDKVNLVTVNDLYTTEQENIKKAVENATIGGIIKSFEVKAWSKDSTAVVFDATSLFMSHMVDIDPFDPYFGYGNKPFNRSVYFEKDKSNLDAIKSFSDNFSVSSKLTYSSTVMYSYKNNSFPVENKVPVTTVVNRSFVLLPEVPMEPRLADPRMNIFPTGKAKFTTMDPRGTLPEYYARRWRVEPKDMGAWKTWMKKHEKDDLEALMGQPVVDDGLVEPVKPIVFYMDPAFPEEWRAPMKDAAEQWNEAFARIGFKNVVEVRMFPTKEEDPEFDPDNLKYSCFRYQPVDFQNAMGPSWFDPRTGEILNATVLVYHDVVKLVSNWMFTQTAAANPAVRNGDIPQDLLDDALRYVVGHEVGHCLSLMHNMAASAAIPVEKLRDPKFTQKHGTTYSIMDYARWNHVAQPGDMEKGVKLTPPRIGLQDFFAMKWLYQPLPDYAGYKEEKVVLDKWISEKSDDARFRYGKQQIYAVLDPSSQSEDLGDDVVKSSEYAVKNLKVIMKNMNKWLKGNDPDLSKRENLYKAMLDQYFKHIYHVYNVKGGIYLNERMQGDKRPSYEFVEAEYQRRAQEFLCNELKDLSWLTPKDLLQEIPLLSNQAIKMQRNLMAFAMADRGSLDSYKHEEFTISDAHDILINSLFENTKKGKSLSDSEITNQIAYINMLNILSNLDKENNPGGGRKLGIADEMPAVQCDEQCYMYSGMCPNFDSVTPEDIMGFSFFRGLSASMYPKFHIYYAKVLEIRDLIESKKNTGNEETRAHYQLMLHNINGMLL